MLRGNNTLLTGVCLFTGFFFLINFNTAGQTVTSFSKSLDSLFNTIFQEDEPGGAVLIAKDDKLIYKNGFGVEDIKTGEPITTRSVFNLGSISKTFVAYGILKLAEEGRLFLDDNLYKYFPDFKDPLIAKKIQIYHLLTHTSGLPDNRQVKKDSIFYLTAKDEENFTPLKQTDSLHFEPGEKFEYSNPAFNALALIIEKVTGLHWQDYIRLIIFEPVGMKNSTITDGPYPQAGVTHGYILNHEKEFEEKDYGEEPTFAAAGNGGVWSSVEELWLYEQAIRQKIF
jgi:CubicO group peptidase (beta-lactamase class C family)